MSLKKRQQIIEHYKKFYDIDELTDEFMIDIDWAEHLIEQDFVKLTVTHSCEKLNASFKKGDIVLIDHKEKRTVIEEFKNGMVELESDKGWTIIGKMRLSLAP